MLTLIISLITFSNIVFSASNLILEDINGSQVDFSTLKGKWVFINYWASWCSPCIEEIAEFNKVFDSNPTNIAIFAVNFDRLTTENQKKVAKDFSIHYPSVQRESTALLALGDISVLPVTFVFNPEGHLATKLYGGQTAEAIKETISDQERRLKLRV
ncbi:MAG: TlpA disulfide reductase family protein [Legionellaceae bacterium]|nr:TlpA disulfide reductase family protein [Legionellaceae bacterium]